MGQKVNPTGLRIGVIKDWESRWYADKSNFGDTLVSDYELREYLLETLAPAGVPKVEIERDAKRVRVNIHCAKPGMVIGRQGAEIEKLKEICKKKLGGDKEVFINIVEIKQPDLNAQLVAENIASQLERRISFRRALKQSIGRTMRLGRVSKLRLAVVSAVPKSLVLKAIMKVLFHFRQSVQTSTMVLQKQTQHTVKSVLKYGFTKVKFFTKAAKHVKKEAQNNAFT